MSYGRRRVPHNSRDDNEDPLLQIAASMGVPWTEGGPLDGWVPISGRWVPVEIKNPDGHAGPGTKNEFRPGQLGFIQDCRRDKLPYFVWRRPECVINSINMARQWAVFQYEKT